MTSIFDNEAIEALAARKRVDRHQLRLLRNGFFKQGKGPTEALALLEESTRTSLTNQIEFHAIEPAGQHDSDLDGASKYLFSTTEGHLIETVALRIVSGRITLCLSSQVGCGCDCRFCASGRMGLTRNLTTAEILDQLIQANLILGLQGERVRNLVFMGMGEPFHNERHLFDALKVLHSSACFDIAPRLITVSTVGIPASMRRFAHAFPKTNLALSLHSAHPETRRQLVPLAEKFPLQEIREALLEVTRVQQKTVLIEYVMLEAINDSDDDITRLHRFLDGIPVHINLIPYNTIEGALKLTGSDLVRRVAFATSLKRLGYKVTLRRSLGADIAAACGQLAHQDRNNKRRLRPEAPEPSSI
jgi:23S rRNA (adenine2503-C2)-methyltransferase